jgi:hypothetical protein
VIKQNAVKNTKTQNPLEENAADPRGDRLRLPNPAEAIKASFPLRVASLTCISLVYTQLLVLMYLMSIVQLKLGFVFLIVCTMCISSLVLKVSFEVFPARLQLQRFHFPQRCRLAPKRFSPAKT